MKISEVRTFTWWLTSGGLAQRLRVHVRTFSKLCFIRFLISSIPKSSLSPKLGQEYMYLCFSSTYHYAVTKLYSPAFWKKHTIKHSIYNSFIPNFLKRHFNECLATFKHIN